MVIVPSVVDQVVMNGFDGAGSIIVKVSPALIPPSEVFPIAKLKLESNPGARRLKVLPIAAVAETSAVI